MSDNPFQTPQYSPDPLETPPGAGPNPLLIPAVFLIILSTLFLGYLILHIAISIIVPTRVEPAGAGNVAWWTSAVIVPAVWAAINAAIALGGVAMLRLKNYSAARLGAICAIIPICSPCFVLGIPFGIWALVVLLSPEVRARFR